MKFLKLLLSDSPEISSKRFVTVISLMLIAAFTVTSFCGIKSDIQILWGLISLCGGSIGFTVLSNVK